MNSRTLTWLSVAALVIIVGAVWVGRSRSPQSTEQQALYPALKGKLSEVTSVSIYKPGDQLAVEMVRDGAQWKLKQRFDHLADASKVNSLLINFESATVREEKTSNPANYPALAVQDVSDANAGGVRVELAGLTPPIKLIVGKRDGATRSTYVRRAGEAPSWLIGAELDVPSDPTAWLKHEILNIGADRIQEAQVQLNNAPAYTLFKNSRADANFDVKGLPKGRELNSVSAPNAIAQSLVSLQLEDVRPASELANEKSAGRTTYKTFDGLVLDVVGYVQGDRHWVTLKASFDPELAKRFHLPTEPAKDAAAKESATTATGANDNEKNAAAATTSNENSLDATLKKGQDESAALNAALANWAYALPSYKYEAIFKPLEELLKKK